MKASRVLLILICLATSTVAGVLYVYRYVYERDILPDVVQTRTVAEASYDESSPVVETPMPTVTYSVLPRYATLYDGVSIGVTGSPSADAFLDYYSFGGYVYVMLEVGSDGGDYRCAAPSIGVARFDASCTLVDAIALPSSAGYTYLCAAMYDYGVMIAASSATDLRVWSVSTNLVVRTKTFPYAVDSARMIYAGGLDVLCATGDNVHLLSLDAELRVAWDHTAPSDAKSVVALYAYRESYIALCTDRTAGCAYVFDESGLHSRAVLPAIDAVTPYAAGIAVASRSEGKLSLFDYSFTRIGEASFARARNIEVCAYENGLLVLIGSGTVEGYLLCNHGEVQYAFTFTAVAPDALHHHDGRFYFTSGTDGVEVYTYVPYDSAPTVVARYVGAVGAVAWCDRYLYCVCESSVGTGYFAETVGSTDVYLLRSRMVE